MLPLYTVRANSSAVIVGVFSTECHFGSDTSPGPNSFGPPGATNASWSLERCSNPIHPAVIVLNASDVAGIPSSCNVNQTGASFIRHGASAVTVEGLVGQVSPLICLAGGVRGAGTALLVSSMGCTADFGQTWVRGPYPPFNVAFGTMVAYLSDDHTYTDLYLFGGVRTAPTAQGKQEAILTARVYAPSASPDCDLSNTTAAEQASNPACLPQFGEWRIIAATSPLRQRARALAFPARVHGGIFIGGGVQLLDDYAVLEATNGEGAEATIQDAMWAAGVRLADLYFINVTTGDFFGPGDNNTSDTALPPPAAANLTESERWILVNSRIPNPEAPNSILDPPFVGIETIATDENQVSLLPPDVSAQRLWSVRRSWMNPPELDLPDPEGPNPYLVPGIIIVAGLQLVVGVGFNVVEGPEPAGRVLSTTYSILYPNPTATQSGASPVLRAPVFLQESFNGYANLAVVFGINNDWFMQSGPKTSVWRAYPTYPCDDPCDTNQYSLGCTAHPFDAACYNCTKCKAALEYESQACRRVHFMGYSDAQCTRCATCSAGFEVLTPCNKTHATVCQAVEALRPRNSDGARIVLSERSTTASSVAAGVMMLVSLLHLARIAPHQCRRALMAVACPKSCGAASARPTLFATSAVAELLLVIAKCGFAAVSIVSGMSWHGWAMVATLAVQAMFSTVAVAGLRRASTPPAEPNAHNLLSSVAASLHPRPLLSLIYSKSRRKSADAGGSLDLMAALGSQDISKRVLLLVVAVSVVSEWLPAVFLLAFLTALSPLSPRYGLESAAVLVAVASLATMGLWTVGVASGLFARVGLSSKLGAYAAAAASAAPAALPSTITMSEQWSPRLHASASSTLGIVAMENPVQPTIVNAHDVYLGADSMSSAEPRSDNAVGRVAPLLVRAAVMTAGLDRASRVAHASTGLPSQINSVPAALSSCASVSASDSMARALDSAQLQNSAQFVSPGHQTAANNGRAAAANDATPFVAAVSPRLLQVLSRNSALRLGLSVIGLPIPENVVADSAPSSGSSAAEDGHGDRRIGSGSDTSDRISSDPDSHHHLQRLQSSGSPSS